MFRVVKFVVLGISLVALTSYVASCSKGGGQTTTTSPTSLSPATTSPSTSPTTATPKSVTFDFDTGSPAPSLRQNTPFDVSSGGITAHFSSPSDPAAFSVQDHSTTTFNLSQFSGNYLNDNTVDRNTLNIKFSQPVVSITLTFATVDYHDPGAGGTATPIQLTAYNGSSTGTPVGSATAHGEFSSDSYPQGTLSFSSGSQAFDTVAVVVPFLAQGATDFLVDNIVVTTPR